MTVGKAHEIHQPLLTTLWLFLLKKILKEKKVILDVPIMQLEI